MSFSRDYTTDEPSRAQLDSLSGDALLEFGAPWCPHCQAIQPWLKETLAQHPEVQHWKIEDGKGRPLGRSFAVKLWPNLVFLRDGQVLQQLARPDRATLLEAFQRFNKER